MLLLQIYFNLALFLVGLVGIIFNRQNLILILMSLEISLLAINLNFICFSFILDDISGQIFALIILCVAAAESAIGLAIFILHYRIRGEISLKSIPSLRF